MPKTRQSKLEVAGLTELVRDRYLGGESFSEIARAYADLGITEGMVAGYIFRNKIKRSEQVEARVQEKWGNRMRHLRPAPEPVELPELLKEPPKVPEAKPYAPIPKPVLPSRDVRRFDVLTWDGSEIVAGGLSAEDVSRKFIPHMTVDRLHMILERDGQIITTSYLVVLVNDANP